MGKKPFPRNKESRKGLAKRGCRARRAASPTRQTQRGKTSYKATRPAENLTELEQVSTAYTATPNLIRDIKTVKGRLPR